MTKPSILIVDDLPENIKLLAGYLAGHYHVLVATSGPTAFELVSQSSPELILLDAMMPEMDGYEVCDRLQRDSATRAIPVLFVTARNDAESESRALAAGAVDFISKPINRDVLLARVRLHLRVKTRERDLQMRLGEIKAIYRTAPVGLCVLDRECRYLHVNRRLAEINGVPAEAHIGRSVGEVVPDVAAAFKSLVARILESGEPLSDIEFSGATARDPGTTRHYLTHWYPLKQNGATHAINLTVEDITEVKSCEIALRKREADLQAANAALALVDRRRSEFLAILGHELRNPLAPIRNGVYALRRLEGAAAAERQQAPALFDMLERQVQALSRMVDDLLEVSRIDAGKIELRSERVDVRTIVGESVESCQALIDASQHTLEVSLPPEPLWVEGDPVRLTQVVVNLLNNAAKYMEPGGRIHIDAVQQADEVVVSVRDQGIGIAPELLPRVFDLFSQASQTERSTTRNQGGLGIGLALGRYLVELHGGTITAHSEGLGRGSEFIVRLPVLGDAPVADKASDRAAAPPMVRRRILIVDDNRDAADSLALLLRMAGNDLRTAYAGAEALQVAATFQPEVLLLDLGMPGMDGYETCRRFRRQPRGKEALVVAVSGWGQEEDRSKARAAGFDHHLVKPAELDDIITLIGTLPPMR